MLLHVDGPILFLLCRGSGWGGGVGVLVFVVGWVGGVGDGSPGPCGICHNRGYAEAAGGIYTYYRACMFSLFLLLRSGGHCEWFCVSTGLSTGCG